MPFSPYRPARQRGQILIMVALSLVAVLAAIGLALDSGMSYLVKAKLNAAVDSASLAGARNVTIGNDQATQAASARSAAGEFFAVNFPSGYMGTTVTQDATGVTFNSGLVTIDTSATATLPLSFLQVVGFNTVPIRAKSQTIRKDLDMMLVMDTSGSLKDSATQVRASAISFLNKFNTSVDRVGLLHFSSGAVLDMPIKTSGRGFDRTAATTLIKAYEFDSGTNSAEGMWNARDQLKGIPELNRSSLRVIVFFSDGSPAAFSSWFFPYSLTGCKEAGSLATYTDINNNPLVGLFRIDKTATMLEPQKSCAANDIAALPAWYNAHNSPLLINDVSLREFPIVTTTPRVVTSSLATATLKYNNVQRASRNLAEAIAAKARAEGIFVFTLGMGASLTAPEGPDNELGQDLLKCMANTTDAIARCRKPAEPVGLYCYAATDSDLSPCFSKLASAILRISK